jgi:hypothetical protein
MNKRPQAKAGGGEQSLCPGGRTSSDPARTGFGRGYQVRLSTAESDEIVVRTRLSVLDNATMGVETM